MNPALALVNMVSLVTLPLWGGSYLTFRIVSDVVTDGNRRERFFKFLSGEKSFITDF